MTSRERRSRPGQGKTDPVDAVAVTRITARESFLPPVRPMDGLPADLRVLMDYREQPRQIPDHLGHSRPSPTQDIYLGRGTATPRTAAAIRRAL